MRDSQQILEGLATVVVALIAAVGELDSRSPCSLNILFQYTPVMVDYPSTAKFLTEDERSFVTQKRGECRLCMMSPTFSPNVCMGPA